MNSPSGALMPSPPVVTEKAKRQSSLWSRCLPTDCPQPEINCCGSIREPDMEPIFNCSSDRGIVFTLVFADRGVVFLPRNRLIKDFTLVSLYKHLYARKVYRKWSVDPI